MRSELKIGIVVGIVIVVGLIIFLVNNSGDDDSNQNEPLYQSPDDNRVQEQSPHPGNRLSRPIRRRRLIPSKG